jgi:cell division protein FtsB
MKPARTTPSPERRPTDPQPDAPDDPTVTTSGDPATASDGVDLSSLSIAGITRRRVGWLTAALVSVWIVVIFARQAGDTAGAAARVDQMTDENRALAAEVASLEQELLTIENPAYIALAARQYRIGKDNEVPFTLDASVAAPGPDAPGSAALRLGPREHATTPLESWLSILFGPAS